MGLCPTVPMAPSPFPGMNPYLEHPDRWSSIHNRLIVALADWLTPQLLPRYQVDIDKRVYEVIGLNTLLVGRPDVTVQRPQSARDRGDVPVSMVSPATPVPVRVPLGEEVREAYLEVKEVATQQVITAIEILSPTNKRGEGRQKYLKKRQQVLNSQTHLVEIDLLRDGEPLPMAGIIGSSDYRILVSRSPQRPIADLYGFDLPDPIPPIPIPLQLGEVEPVVDLGELLGEVYGRSGYDTFIDYHQDPLPPLSEQSLAWLDRWLQQHQRR